VPGEVHRRRVRQPGVEREPDRRLLRVVQRVPADAGRELTRLERGVEDPPDPALIEFGAVAVMEDKRGAQLPPSDATLEHLP